MVRITSHKSNSSKSGIVPLHPDERKLIRREYKSAKDAWRDQADLALELAERLERLKDTIDDIKVQDDLKEQLRKKVSDVDNITNHLLRRISKLFDHIDELATATKVVK